MFIALLIGAVIGISGAGKFLLSLNGGKGIFLTQVIKVCGDCMSPIAMIMTGITFAFIDIKKCLADKSIYIVTALRLIVYPLVFGTIAWLFRNYVFAFDDAIFKCFVISLAMPLGLNTIGFAFVIHCHHSACYDDFRDRIKQTILKKYAPFVYP